MKTRLPDCQGRPHFPNLLEFGCIVKEVNIQLMSVNKKVHAGVNI